MKLKQTLSYGFSNSIVKAKKRKLLSDAEVKNLIETDTISEAVSVLDNTIYRDFLYGKTEYKEIDKALLKHLVEVEKDINRYSPEPLDEILRAYLERWEIQNLKLALRIVKSKRGDFRESAFPYESSLFETLENVSTSETLKEAGKVLSDTKYAFLEKVLGGESKNLKEAEIKLDRHHYNELISELKNQPQAIQDFFGIQIDKTNLQTVLKAIKEDVNEEEIEEYILPPYKIDSEKIEEIISSENIKNALSPLESTYLKDLADLEIEEDDSLLKINLELESKIKEISEKIYRSEPLGPGVIFGFLMFKRQEVQQLRKIFAYKNANWSNQKIKKRVI